MAEYISLPIEVDPLELQEQAVNILQGLVPGWTPAEGNLDYWILQVSARMAAELREFARDVPDTIFLYFGQEMMNVFPKVASYATFTSTWTALDNAGYVIPAGTTVGVRKPDGDQAGFQTIEEYTIPNGSTSVDEVTLAALESGAEGSGLPTTLGQVSLIDSLPWVDTIVGDDVTTGGEDGETAEDYQARLVEEIRLMSPRPILPADFATLAKRVPGVERAYYINLWNAATNTANVEKCVTVVVTDSDGEPVSAGAKDDVLALLQDLREVNFLVFVRDPQYQNIAITYTVVSMPNADTVAVKVAVDAAINEFISPRRWGEVVFGTDVAEYWRPVNTVRRLEVATVINNVSGVDYISALTLDGSSSADITLAPGAGIPIVLPRVTTLTGTVT